MSVNQVHWSVNIFTHGRYLMSANKARRPVYTSTQRRVNLQSCLLQGWLNSKPPVSTSTPHPSTLQFLLLQGPQHLNHTYVYNTLWAVQMSLHRIIYIQLLLRPSTSSSTHLPTGGSQSTYWWLSVYLLVALSLPTGGSQSTYWWLSVYTIAVCISVNITWTIHFLLQSD